MSATFHLSIGVKSIEESVEFFVDVMSGRVAHRDHSGYVNIELLGAQITLKPNPDIKPDLADFHFGFNLKLEDFDKLVVNILARGRHRVVMEPKLVDANTILERKKMYLRCPTGYLIELKGYKPPPARL